MSEETPKDGVVAAPVQADPVAQGRLTIDPLLQALDPDRTRPAHVIQAEQLCLSFGAKRILSDIDVGFPREPSRP